MDKAEAEIACLYSQVCGLKAALESEKAGRAAERCELLAALKIAADDLKGWASNGSHYGAKAERPARAILAKHGG